MQAATNAETIAMIDLRSDTLTLPTNDMREAMRHAALGDDARDGDPTVRRLEEMSAEATGKEAGLLVASGTMSNLVALLAHGNGGGETDHELTSNLDHLMGADHNFRRLAPDFAIYRNEITRDIKGN
jgi:cystathionine beta-lyase/cystathionine gamma-synthase